MKIGEFLVSAGSLTEYQVGIIIQLQKAGDTRKFGEIAVSKGFMPESSITRFTDFLSGHQEFGS